MKLETMAWGCFLVMLGGLFFVPGEVIAKGCVVDRCGRDQLLGLNVVRYFNKIRMKRVHDIFGHRLHHRRCTGVDWRGRS